MSFTHRAKDHTVVQLPLTELGDIFKGFKGFKDFVKLSLISDEFF